MATDSPTSSFPLDQAGKETASPGLHQVLPETFLGGNPVLSLRLSSSTSSLNSARSTTTENSVIIEVVPVRSPRHRGGRQNRKHRSLSQVVLPLPAVNQRAVKNFQLNYHYGHHRISFSTKYEDVETGLRYYGYRYYDPVTGRWPSRDPIEEDGGMNLYGMVENDVINKQDLLGMAVASGSFNVAFPATVQFDVSYSCSNVKLMNITVSAYSVVMVVGLEWSVSGAIQNEKFYTQREECKLADGTTGWLAWWQFDLDYVVKKRIKAGVPGINASIGNWKGHDRGTKTFDTPKICCCLDESDVIK